MIPDNYMILLFIFIIPTIILLYFILSSPKLTKYFINDDQHIFASIASVTFTGFIMFGLIAFWDFILI